MIVTEKLGLTRIVRDGVRQRGAVTGRALNAVQNRQIANFAGRANHAERKAFDSNADIEAHRLSCAADLSRVLGGGFLDVCHVVLHWGVRGLYVPIGTGASEKVPIGTKLF